MFVSHNRSLIREPRDPDLERRGRQGRDVPGHARRVHVLDGPAPPGGRRGRRGRGAQGQGGSADPARHGQGGGADRPEHGEVARGRQGPQAQRGRGAAEAKLAARPAREAGRAARGADRRRSRPSRRCARPSSPIRPCTTTRRAATSCSPTTRLRRTSSTSSTCAGKRRWPSSRPREPSSADDLGIHCDRAVDPQTDRRQVPARGGRGRGRYGDRVPRGRSRRRRLPAHGRGQAHQARVPRAQELHRHVRRGGARRLGARAPEHRPGPRLRQRERLATTWSWSGSRASTSAPSSGSTATPGRRSPGRSRSRSGSARCAGSAPRTTGSRPDGTAAPVIHRDVSPAQRVARHQRRGQAVRFRPREGARSDREPDRAGHRQGQAQLPRARGHVRSRRTARSRICSASAT